MIFSFSAAVKSGSPTQVTIVRSIQIVLSFLIQVYKLYITKLSNVYIPLCSFLELHEIRILLHITGTWIRWRSRIEWSLWSWTHPLYSCCNGFWEENFGLSRQGQVHILLQTCSREIKVWNDCLMENMEHFPKMKYNLINPLFVHQAFSYK